MTTVSLRPDSPQTDEGVRTPAIAWYALGVLILAVLFGFIDRQIIVLVVEPMKRELGITDLQVGSIQGLGPALFALLAGYPLAWLADRVNRSWLLAACILFWSAATAARGLSSSFSELMVFSTGIAVGEAVLTPIIYSLIPDLFPGKRRREMANFIFYGAVVIGVGIGLTLGGAALGLAESIRPFLPENIQGLSDWRLACLIVAAPGLLIAVLVLPIPNTRRAQAGSLAVPDAQAPLWPYFKAYWRPVSTIYASMGMWAFAYLIIGTWLPVAIVRDLHASPEDVGVGFGSTFTVAAAIGIGLAFASAPFMRKVAGQAHAVRALSVSSGLAGLFVIALLFAASPAHAYLLAGVTIALLTAGAAYSPTMLQNMAPPLLRARVASISLILYAILGASGPMAAGALSDMIGGGPGSLMAVVALLAGAGFAMAALGYWLVEKRFLKMAAALEMSSPALPNRNEASA